MRLGRFRPAAAVLLFLHLSACTSWQPTYVSPSQLIPRERPTSVRATLSGGARVTLEFPIMRNDSILGDSDFGVLGVASSDLVGPLEVRRFSLGRTIGLAVLPALSMYFLAAVSGEPICC